MVLLGKIMILQGVGHQISCLGVCYANDPRKGGYTTPAPALDLTTSLRGDFATFLNGEVSPVKFSPPELSPLPPYAHPRWSRVAVAGCFIRSGNTVLECGSVLSHPRDSPRRVDRVLRLLGALPHGVGLFRTPSDPIPHCLPAGSSCLTSFEHGAGLRAGGVHRPLLRPFGRPLLRPFRMPPPHPGMGR